MLFNVAFCHIGFETSEINRSILELVAGRCKMKGNDYRGGVTAMVYETKFTRLTPAADFSMESLEQQFQLKMELEQVEQYLKENYPDVTELHLMSPELALEALGSEMLHAISRNRQEEKERADKDVKR